MAVDELDAVDFFAVVVAVLDWGCCGWFVFGGWPSALELELSEADDDDDEVADDDDDELLSSESSSSLSSSSSVFAM